MLVPAWSMVARSATERLGLKLLAGGLVDRVGFAGQRRFVHPRVERLQEAHVGRHAVAGFDQHHVARHQAGAFDELHRAVAENAARRLDRGAERGGVDLGAPFLRAADRRVQDEHGADEASASENSPSAIDTAAAASSR